jgi:hypothetical protein
MEKPTKKEEQERVISSAISVIKYILKIKKGVLLEHKKRILTSMIWVITEADGLTAEKRTGYKKKITYISESVKKRRDSGDESIKGLIHEHVYKRKNIVQELLNEQTNIELILKKAIGCIVTSEEHHKLHKIKDNECDGWERYKKAGIKVFDTKNNKWFI